jgi:preprotein translocase subunit SecB
MTDQGSTTPQVVLQKLYVKDISFESPSSPQVFLQAAIKPSLQIDLSSTSRRIDADLYEVVLEITLTARNQDQSDKTLFLIEVEQAGLFTIKGFPDEAVSEVLGVFCPHTLFPYLREVVDSCALKGGFPPLLLAPINFESMYRAQAGSRSTQPPPEE